MSGFKYASTLLFTDKDFRKLCSGDASIPFQLVRDIPSQLQSPATKSSIVDCSGLPTRGKLEKSGLPLFFIAVLDLCK